MGAKIKPLITKFSHEPGIFLKREPPKYVKVYVNRRVLEDVCGSVPGKVYVSVVEVEGREGVAIACKAIGEDVAWFTGKVLYRDSPTVQVLVQALKVYEAVMERYARTTEPEEFIPGEEVKFEDLILVSPKAVDED